MWYIQNVLVALELPVCQFGLEAAGIITRVRANVNLAELGVGDRLFCLRRKAFCIYVTPPTVLCTRDLDNLSHDGAASMPVPCVTAIHSLVNVRRLAEGQGSRRNLSVFSHYNVDQSCHLKRLVLDTMHLYKQSPFRVVRAFWRLPAWRLYFALKYLGSSSRNWRNRPSMPLDQVTR